MTIKSILATALALLPFHAKAEEWSEERKRSEAEQQYNYMQNIVVGVVAGTTDMATDLIPEPLKDTRLGNIKNSGDKVTNALAQDPKSDGVAVGKALAPVVVTGVGTYAATMTLGQRVTRLEELAKMQDTAIKANETALKATQEAINTTNNAIKAIEKANTQQQRNIKALETYGRQVEADLSTMAEKVWSNPKE